MKKPHSQRRIIHDTATPEVISYDRSGVTLFVHPIGRPQKGVTFTMAWHQYRNLRGEVGKASSKIGCALREQATAVENAAHAPALPSPLRAACCNPE